MKELKLWRVLYVLVFFIKHNGGITIKDLKINEEIKDKKLRLIDQAGNQVGIVDRQEALDMAFNANLDLVMMSPNAKPPVVRILDYGKFKYDAIKKAKENKKNQKNAQLKETRFSLNIDDHDLNTKANQTKKFLSNGDKVKVSVRFRGRELGHKDLGYVLLDKFIELVKDVAQVDKKPAMEGRSLVMFISKKEEEKK